MIKASIFHRWVLTFFHDFDINYLNPFQSFGAMPLCYSLIILFKLAVGPSFGLCSCNSLNIYPAFSQSPLMYSLYPSLNLFSNF